MPLKQIDIAAPKAKAKKNSTPVIQVEGVKCATYISVCNQITELEATKATLREELVGVGVKELFQYNHDNPDIQSSVKLQDDSIIRNGVTVPAPDGAVVCISSQDKYSSADASAADEVFSAIGEDINDYMVQTAKASFDSKFFLDKDGNFDQAVYDATMQAMDAIAKRFKKTNPVTCNTVVTPKPGFHEKRMKQFTPENNLRISEVVRNTVTVKESKL